MNTQEAITKFAGIVQQMGELTALHDLFPEIQNRYEHLRGLLLQANTESDVAPHRLQLAIGDMQSVLAACGFVQEEVDDHEAEDATRL